MISLHLVNNTPVMGIDPNGYKLCLASAVERLDGMTSCVGPGGGSSLAARVSKGIAQVKSYYRAVSQIIGYIQNNNFEKANSLFYDLIPRGAPDLLGNGVNTVGIYVSAGGLVIDGVYIALGLTIGAQITVDKNGGAALQAFVGGGIHALPHIEVGYYVFYNYPTATSYSQLNGSSIQANLSLAKRGITGEYIFSDQFAGIGYSKTLLNVSLPLTADFNFVIEYQHTWTIVS